MGFFFTDKTIKLWKVSERDKKAEGYNLKEDSGLLRDPSTINTLRVRKFFIIKQLMILRGVALNLGLAPSF